MCVPDHLVHGSYFILGDEPQQAFVICSYNLIVLNDQNTRDAKGEREREREREYILTHMRETKEVISGVTNDESKMV